MQTQIAKLSNAKYRLKKNSPPYAESVEVEEKFVFSSVIQICKLKKNSNQPFSHNTSY
jgi:hypothetical protein